MNPRAAINDLLTFQASPFGHLGTSPIVYLHFISLLINVLTDIKTTQGGFYVTERVGFEPTAPFGVTGFQDQLLKPLGHLSMYAFA